MTERAAHTPDFEQVREFLALHATPETHGQAVDAYNEFVRAMAERAWLIKSREELLSALEELLGAGDSCADWARDARGGGNDVHDYENATFAARRIIRASKERAS